MQAPELLESLLVIPESPGVDLQNNCYLLSAVSVCSQTVMVNILIKTLAVITLK